MTIKEIQQEILRMKKEQIIWETPTDSAGRLPRATAAA